MLKRITSAAFLAILMLCAVSSCRNKIEVTSPIVEKKADLSTMPSYCDPANYKILKVNSKYFVQLPAGTIGSDGYSSAEDAQEDINDRAERSYERWINSGGADF